MISIKEIFKPVNDLPCNDCNFKTNPSNCWYFGNISFIENKIRNCMDVISIARGGQQLSRDKRSFLNKFLL